MTTNERMGGEIRERRTRIRVSQAWVALAADVSRATVINLESGQGASRRSTVRIIKALEALEQGSLSLRGVSTVRGELDALQVATEAMSGLDREARLRVLRYLTERFGEEP